MRSGLQFWIWYQRVVFEPCSGECSFDRNQFLIGNIVYCLGISVELKVTRLSIAPSWTDCIKSSWCKQQDAFIGLAINNVLTINSKYHCSNHATIR
jgi:hypothetical protein